MTNVPMMRVEFIIIIILSFYDMHMIIIAQLQDYSLRFQYM